MKVRIISQRGASALVEWFDGEQSRRAYVPAGSLTALPAPGDYACAVLDQGIPYGLPWADLVRLTVSPEAVEAELHRHGLWTAEDLARRPREAQAAFAALYAHDVAALLRAARAHNQTSLSSSEPDKE